MDFVARAELRLIVHIDEDGPQAVLPGHGFDRGFQGATRAAPGGPEIDEDGGVRAEDVAVEIDLGCVGEDRVLEGLMVISCSLPVL